MNGKMLIRYHYHRNLLRTYSGRKASATKFMLYPQIFLGPSFFVWKREDRLLCRIRGIENFFDRKVVCA